MLIELLEKVPKNVVNLVTELKPLKEKYRTLEQVDLVIEGGVGGHRTMANVAKFLFPEALYIGADLHPFMIPIHQKRLSISIDPQILRVVQEANKSEDSFPDSALVCADCFDEGLVHDIMQKSGCRFPLLVSIDCLPFLISNLNAGEPKLSSDYHPIEDILFRKTPFIGQLHVTSNPLWHKDGQKPGNEGYYYELEEAAIKTGWKVDRHSNALILLR